MNLFDQIISAVGNSQQQASPKQLGGILEMAQQLGNSHGVDAGTTQMILSALGNHVRSSLQNKQASMGSDQVQSLVNQYGGLGSNPDAVQAVFSQGQQQQVASDISQQTGLNAGTIQAMLPILVPIVLNFLQSGANPQNAQAGNPVLNTFLDSNHDGSVDLGDVMGMAGQFLRQRR